MRSKTFTGSTHLDHAKYDSGSKELTVKFRKGGTYVYKGVPDELIDAWFKTKQSASHFFRTNIRPEFQVEKVPEAQKARA